MFKFIKQYAEKMDHAQIYPLISLLIFFGFFVVLLYFVKKMDKTTVQDLSGIPLDEKDPFPIN
ncbi:MAG: CcoQ/FixQ family Cbb3-type cytochrome c oxidase assembly chaperone [Bacteroidota bacterium]|nr:CcoQ/FixQ family Cbb3-type cytochrome c oxidase assembly chaperone [Ferruginibacter sp.]